MRSPEGKLIQNRTVVLEIVPQERIVTTDADSEGWVPAKKPFMTSVVTLADAGGGKTTYSASARHWTAEDQQTHEKMGFRDGWTTAARQLEALAKSL